jgi:hypothetical protein
MPKIKVTKVSGIADANNNGLSFTCQWYDDESTKPRVPFPIGLTMQIEVGENGLTSQAQIKPYGDSGIGVCPGFFDTGDTIRYYFSDGSTVDHGSNSSVPPTARNI